VFCDCKAKVKSVGCEKDCRDITKKDWEVMQEFAAAGVAITGLALMVVFSGYQVDYFHRLRQADIAKLAQSAPLAQIKAM
jgi:hypothetical protein